MFVDRIYLALEFQQKNWAASEFVKSTRLLTNRTGPAGPRMIFLAHNDFNCQAIRVRA